MEIDIGLMAMALLWLRQKNFDLTLTNFRWPFLVIHCRLLLSFSAVWNLRNGKSFPIFDQKLIFHRPELLLKTFFLVSSYFTSHPITVVLEILVRRMHGPSPNGATWALCLQISIRANNLSIIICRSDCKTRYSFVKLPENWNFSEICL